MRTEIGHAVMVPHKTLGETAQRLIRLHIREFNLIDAGDFRLVIFRHEDDAERFCQIERVEVAESGAHYSRNFSIKSVADQI